MDHEDKKMDHEKAEDEEKGEHEEEEEDEEEEEEEEKMMDEKKPKKKDDIDDLYEAVTTLKKHGIGVYTGQKTTPAPTTEATIEEKTIDWNNLSKFVLSKTVVLFDDYYDNRDDVGCKQLITKLDDDSDFLVKYLYPVDIINSLQIRMVKVQRAS